MTHGPLPISVEALVGAAALLLLNGLLSLWLGLKLERRLLVASLRTVVQLVLLGTFLVPIFELQRPEPVWALCMVMVALAAREATKRASYTYKGFTAVSFLALFVGAGTTAVVGAGLLIGVEPWWEPRYLLPLLGMILGNALTGVSLGVDRCLVLLDQRRDRIEAWLAAGATSWQASRPIATEALRVGMLPILNTMSVVGLVTIPGMMTGQLLGGSPPDVAARYQILIMFLIAAAVALGTSISILLSLKLAFDDQHRLRADRLQPRR